jgi:hypothetical protein
MADPDPHTNPLTVAIARDGMEIVEARNPKRSRGSSNEEIEEDGSVKR